MPVPCPYCKTKWDELKHEVEVHKRSIATLNDRLFECRKFEDRQSYLIDGLKARLALCRIEQDELRKALGSDLAAEAVKDGLGDIRAGKGAEDESSAQRALRELGFYLIDEKEDA